MHYGCCGLISKYNEGLIALRKFLESREDKTIFTDSVMDLAECVIKGTTIGTKMDPPYSITFMGDLEKRILQECSFSAVEIH